MEKKESELKKNRQILSELLPSLESIGKLTAKSQEAEIFVGQKGIMTAYEQLLKNVPDKEIVRFFLPA